VANISDEYKAEVVALSCEKSLACQVGRAPALAHAHVALDELMNCVDEDHGVREVHVEAAGR
jgi:hypothetical protein